MERNGENFVQKHAISTMVCVGLLTSVFGLLAVGLSVVIHVNFLNSRDINEMSIGSSIFTTICTVFYLMSSFIGACMVCAAFQVSSQGVNQPFRCYQIVLVISIIAAFFEMFVVFTSSSAASAFFACYLIAGLACFVLSSKLQNELMRRYDARMQQFNESGFSGNALVAMSGQSGLPKFSVPVTVEKYND